MSQNLKLEMLSVEHDYYCSDSNFYSSKASERHKTFDEFYEDFKNADVDMNLVFRWDVTKVSKDVFCLDIFMIQQRKGIFKPIHIELFEEKDVPNFTAYLYPHIEKLKSIWKPFEF